MFIRNITLSILLANAGPALCFAQASYPAQWQRITENRADDYHPSFSPDDSKILFDSNFMR
jgi:hypothetical protein